MPWCVECEDVGASVRCEECGDELCGLCFQWQHRSGKRAKHSPTPLPGMQMFRERVEGTTAHFMQLHKGSGGAADEKEAPLVGDEEMADNKEGAGRGKSEEDSGSVESKAMRSAIADRLIESSKYIPLRVSGEERTLLKLLEGALEVSEYTDKVDVVRGWSFRNTKADVIREEIADLLQLLLGLIVAGNPTKGSEIVKNKQISQNEEFFQRVLEIGRRFKITNPEKMRCTYGKLIYLMQDAPSAIDLDVAADIHTVYNFLEARDALEVLADEDIGTAIMAVSSSEGGVQRSRAELEADSSNKQKAIRSISERYANDKISKEEIEYCLFSMGDFHAYLETNRRPVDEMIALLTANFDPNKAENPYSLEICSGSKLSHTHSTQYTFVLQSLQLWRHVTQEMFRLWILAEKDLLNPDNQYRLMNTGQQGMNRVQSAPKIAHAMHAILSKVQSKCGSWVGLSVVHLGDRDVPNALVFIDKYTQIARLLGPIVHTVRSLPRLAKDPATSKIVNEEFGGPDVIRRTILADFFKHGFDGSGSDGGSCIDGRLTSAWNWCSKLEKKSYYPIFLLAGFQGFDGDFRK
ncbi:hypothetical protein GUITHDRAFT_96082 [Guillardia theta CCMP2712]|uniref:B box-type domain-containing protein n=1 Tax=Guillardia theta (strain CCMP2712) TaxID=905079 RepID=L1IZP0_GUITC|nr:hypothetical protein GUITHDRAFT_96082 [Guillardia theta CCMP2712]EKX41270.1 hypothetical protein GUITHDRAFT_96082 [Guillardia theta CCMP2712]|eukprot:XP_005828250.1 hypothetical protein GUITHDRAFT_96082 [Guillardia theta CCMP2712]